MSSSSLVAFAIQPLIVFLDCLDLLVYDLLLVFGQGDRHASEVCINCVEKTIDVVMTGLIQILSLLQVIP